MRSSKPTRMRTIRVLLSDDGQRARAGLRALLDTYPEVDIVGEAREGGQAMALVDRLHPDVVLMDIRMPGIDGLAATRRIKSRWPYVGVVLITVRSDLEQAATACGADGFLVKGCSPDALLESIRQAVQSAYRPWERATGGAS